MNEEQKKIKLINVINDIANETLLTEDNKQNYIKQLEKIYTNDFRHEYSEITGVLFSIESIEGRDYLAHKIKDMYEYVEKKLGDDNKPLYTLEFKKSLRKLWDHVNLENIRMNELARISENANKASEKANSTEEKLKEADIKISNLNSTIQKINNKTKDFDKKIKGFNQNINSSKKQLNNLHKNMKNSTTEFVTILSIFAAIVIGFTGGMTYISNAIISLGQIGPYRAGVFILLIGIIMFDTIFLLLYMIAKLTDKYIGSIGKCKNGGEFCNTKTIGCCLNRYPYVIFFNASIILLIISAILLYGVDRYNIISMWVNYFIKDFNWYKLFTLIATLIITYFTLKQIGIYDKFKNTINKVINYKCNCS